MILCLLLASATEMYPFPTEAHQFLFPEAAISAGIYRLDSVSLEIINLMSLGNGRLLQEGHYQLQSCVVSVITGTHTRGISKVTSQISRVTLLASVE